jgi:diguanylate cyclase (GGDEF)-like protein
VYPEQALKIETKTQFAYAALAALPFVEFFRPAIGGHLILEPSTLQGLSNAPWVGFPILAFLGWRLNQTRILFASLLLLLCFALLRQGGGAGLLGMVGDPLSFTLSFATPFALLCVFLVPESALFSQRSLVRLLLGFAPFLLISGLASQDGGALNALSGWEAFDDGFFRLPHVSLIALLAFTAAAWLSREPKIRSWWIALAWALWPIELALESRLSRPSTAPHDTMVVLCFLSSLLILGWAIFDMYWHRVYIDELTGVPNRRALDEALHRLEPPYALAMVDIDHFKKFNDSYGHEEGDNVLRYVAAHLAQTSQGRAYRYGGEEFCLVFPGWDSRRAEELADSIRESLSRKEFFIRLPEAIREKTSDKDRGTLKAKGKHVSVTISLGVAAPDKNCRYYHEVIALADEGLYEAKDKGRNRVVRMN